MKLHPRRKISNQWEIDALFNAGVKWMLHDIPLQARTLFLHVLEKDPAHRGALVNLGVLDYQSGDLRQADERLCEAVNLAETAQNHDTDWFTAVYYQTLIHEKDFAVRFRLIETDAPNAASQAGLSGEDQDNSTAEAFYKEADNIEAGRDPRIQNRDKAAELYRRAGDASALEQMASLRAAARDDFQFVRSCSHEAVLSYWHAADAATIVYDDGSVLLENIGALWLRAAEIRWFAALEQNENIRHQMVALSFQFRRQAQNYRERNVRVDTRGLDNTFSALLESSSNPLYWVWKLSEGLENALKFHPPVSRVPASPRYYYGYRSSTLPDEYIHAITPSTEIVHARVLYRLGRRFDARVQVIRVLQPEHLNRLPAWDRLELARYFAVRVREEHLPADENEVFRHLNRALELNPLLARLAEAEADFDIFYAHRRWNHLIDRAAEQMRRGRRQQGRSSL